MFGALVSIVLSTVELLQKKKHWERIAIEQHERNMRNEQDRTKRVQMEQEFEERKKTFYNLNKVFTTYSQNYKTGRVVARINYLRGLSNISIPKYNKHTINIIGSTSTGKTSLINTFYQLKLDTSFRENTKGITTVYETPLYKVNDIFGQNNHPDKTYESPPMFEILKKAHTTVILFSEDINTIIDIFMYALTLDTNIVLVHSKVDREDDIEELETYDKEKLREFIAIARSHGFIQSTTKTITYFPVSSKTKYNTSELLTRLEALAKGETTNDLVSELYEGTSGWGGHAPRSDNDNSTTENEQVESAEQVGRLHAAAEMGDLGGAKEALQSGIHVDSLDKEGKTPLMVAAIYGHTAMISLLLDRGGAKLDLTHEKYGTTALHWACQYGHKEVVITLIRKGCNYELPAKDGHTPLSVAAYWGNSDVVSVLVSLLVKTNKITADGKTAAEWARFRGHNGVADMLDFGLQSLQGN